MKKKILISLYIIICILIILTPICYGYLDPSAMTYFIQLISAVFIAIGTVFGVVVYRIKKFFKSKKKGKKVVKMNIDEIMNEANQQKENSSKEE